MSEGEPQPQSEIQSQQVEINSVPVQEVSASIVQ